MHYTNHVISFEETKRRYDENVLLLPTMYFYATNYPDICKRFKFTDPNPDITDDKAKRKYARNAYMIGLYLHQENATPHVAGCGIQLLRLNKLTEILKALGHATDEVGATTRIWDNHSLTKDYDWVLYEGISLFTRSSIGYCKLHIPTNVVAGTDNLTEDIRLLQLIYTKVQF